MQKPMRQSPWQQRKSEYFVKIDGFVRSQFLFAEGKGEIMNEKDSQPNERKAAKQSRRAFLRTGAAAAGAALLGSAVKATPSSATDQAQESIEEVQLLFVQTSKDVVLEKGKMTLKGISPMTIFFSDRPKRIAGHMATEDFVVDWKEGKGKNSFVDDPPNATLSIFGKDEIVDIVVELKNPRLKGNDLIYDIGVLEQDHPITSGPCSLFIDPVGMPLSPTSVAGVHRRHRRRARRRHAVIR
jgi:hypothetical protein